MKDCKHKPMRDDCPVCLWKQGNTDKALRVAEEQIDDKIKLGRIEIRELIKKRRHNKDI